MKLLTALLLTALPALAARSRMPYLRIKIRREAAKSVSLFALPRPAKT